jgi:hypothetical protein
MEKVLPQLFIAVIISALVALLGKDRKIGYGWSFVLCLFLSPIIGFIIILCSKKNDKVNFVDIPKENEQK